MISYIDTKQEYKEFISWIQPRRILAVDTETTGLDPFIADILMIQVGDGDRQWVLDYQRLLADNVSFTDLTHWLENPGYKKVFHNAKFDYKMLKHHLKCEPRAIYCTFVLEHLLKKGIRKKGFGLADVAARYVRADLDKATRQTFAEHTLLQDFTNEQIIYAAVDVEFLIEIFNKQWEFIKKIGIEDLAELECAAIAPTGDMELNGIYLDPRAWRSLFELSELDRQRAEIKLADAFKLIMPRFKVARRELAIAKEMARIDKQEQAEAAKLSAKAQDNLGFLDAARLDTRAIAEKRVSPAQGFSANFDSPEQMKLLLSIYLDTVIKDTAIETLEAISDPIAEKVIALRKATKLCTTYGEKFLEKAIHPITGRIHTRFNQTGTDSGRYSSSQPVNLQNIPNKTEYRAAFKVQDSDWRMICADYSGCELRLIAEICDEPKWIEVLHKGYDMHSYVASLLFKIPYEEIVDETHTVKAQYKKFRSQAKAINFGVAYGMKAGRLADKLEVSYKEAKELLDKFWTSFPNIKNTLDSLEEDAVNLQYAYSPLDGRRRYLRTFDFDVEGEKSHAQNIAKNLPFQGGNASITKRALVYIRNEALKRGWGSDQFRILITVHDEIECECKKELVTEATKMVEELMLEAAHFYLKKVPMVVDVDVGDHWIH